MQPPGPRMVATEIGPRRPSTYWPAHGVQQDAKPREQLHARVRAIDRVVRTKEAPPMGTAVFVAESRDRVGCEIE